MSFHSRVRFAGAAIFLLGTGVALAEPGVSDDSILIGQSADFSALLSASVKETTAGAQAYLDSVNRKGGINGRKVILKSLDDAYDAKRAAANTKTLIENDKVFSLFLYRGTPTTEAALPILTAAKVPLLAPITGAQSLHEPFNRYVFHVRAKYQSEAGKIIDQLTALGMTKIGVIYANDSFGKDGLTGVRNGLSKRGLTPIVEASFDNKNSVYGDAIKLVTAATPQAVVIIASSKSASECIKQTKKAGIDPQFVTLSINSSQSFVKEMGTEGRGVGITTVMPYPWSAGTAVVKEYREVLKQAKIDTISYLSLEGFISAKVLVEGLKRAGPNITREKFITAMETMHDYDVGGFHVSYAPDDRDGSRFIEVTVIGQEGKFLR
jgi:branched-chain amino acid transport system substrate-binding protein